MMNDNTDLSNESIKIFENSNNVSYNNDLITCQNFEILTVTAKPTEPTEPPEPTEQQKHKQKHLMINTQKH